MTQPQPQPQLQTPFKVRCPACRWVKDVVSVEDGRSWASVHVRRSPWRCVIHLIKRWSGGEEIVDLIQVRPISRVRVH